RARRFHKVMEKIPSTLPSTPIYLFASNTIPTLYYVRLVKEKEEWVCFFQDQSLWVEGDGIVSFRSALGDLRKSRSSSRLKTCIPWRGTYFFHGTHREMVNSPVFQNNLLFLLLETPLILGKDTEGELEIPKGLKEWSLPKKAEKNKK
ncbi:MAG: hypothetical protein D6785_00565, partial [Planctomycetota bacterium]